jgi:hypothetical protein
LGQEDLEDPEYQLGLELGLEPERALGLGLEDLEGLW